MLWYKQPDDGCFMQPKHVTAIGFATIKVVCRLTVLIANKILYATTSIVSEMRAACPEILIFFELMTVVICDEEY